MDRTSELTDTFLALEDPLEFERGRTLLRHSGVLGPANSWRGPKIVAVAKAVPELRGTFTLDPAGDEMLILANWDRPQPLDDGIGTYEPDPCLDMIAINPDTPDTFWTMVEWPVLGGIWMERASQRDEPIRIYRNPLTWLQAGGHGACVLDWKAPPTLLLASCGRILAEDQVTAARLSALTRKSWAPAIRVAA